MKHYKDENENIFAIDVEQESIILDEWVEISNEEMQVIIDSRKTKAEKYNEKEDIEWNEYLMAEQRYKKAAWKLAGKPKYKGN